MDRYLVDVHRRSEGFWVLPRLTLNQQMAPQLFTHFWEDMSFQNIIVSEIKKERDNVEVKGYTILYIFELTYLFFLN